MQNGRDVRLGLVVVGVRAGAAAGRLIALPARILVRGPLRPVVSRVEEEASRAGYEARERARTRAEEATTAALGAPELERMLDAALAGPLSDAVARRVVDRVLASPELDRVVEHVASSAAVRNAVAKQTSTFADELATQLRDRCAQVDDRAERTVRLLFRRRPRRAALPGRLYGGIATRTVGFAVDLVLVAVAFLVAAALGALVTSVVGDPSGSLAAALLAVGWTLAAATYFVFFWSAAGQTPGMRVMRQRVVARRGEPPTVLRAVVRFVVLFSLLVGAVLVLFDGRRRGLHDVVAGTVVTSAP